MADDSVGVRLSEGLVTGGPLSTAAIQRGLDTLEQLTLAHNLRSKKVRAVATAVLRKTSDPGPFVDPAEQIVGHPIEIIEGEEEARLTCEGAVAGLPDAVPWIILDIGGQSTEFSWQGKDGRRQSVSIEMGVVGLTEQFLVGDPPASASVDRLRQLVRRVIEKSVPAGIDGELLAVAGTASSIAMLDKSLVKWQREEIHGARISSAALSRWMGVMASVSSHERQHVYGVRPVRADVFPAGICILEEALRFLKLDGFTVSATGLRLGVALSIL